MAEQVTDTSASETARKATPKRKPAAKRKPVAKKTAATRKPAARRKPVAKRKPANRKSTPAFATRAIENSRSAFLASLGFYGTAYDQMQEQFSNLQDRLEKRRKQVEATYLELVKRGEKVEKEARKAVDDIELPKFELVNITDRKKLDKQLKKARARFEELKDTVFKAAA